MRRLGHIGITTTLLVLAVPGLARAGTVRGEIARREELRYVAHPGEVNHVTITGSRTTYSVHDAAGVTAGRDCTQIDATTATCESSRHFFNSVGVITGDRNDIVHISSDHSTYVKGGIGDDRLFGASNAANGGAGDVLTGGPGATRWAARRGSARSSATPSGRRRCRFRWTASRTMGDAVNETTSCPRSTP